MLPLTEHKVPRQLYIEHNVIVILEDEKSSEEVFN